MNLVHDTPTPPPAENKQPSQADRKREMCGESYEEPLERPGVNLVPTAPTPPPAENKQLSQTLEGKAQLRIRLR